MIAANIEKITQQLPKQVKLIAVSKTQPIELLKEVYQAGIKAFGENKVQEMVAKQPQMPIDTEWHLIGHLQTNKVKYIAPFVHLIHSVDSIKLLTTINKEAHKNNRIINVLLQVYIATEETKFGLNETELVTLLHDANNANLNHIAICGLMGMASNTDNSTQIENEFSALQRLFRKIREDITSYPILLPDKFTELSMGMSSDYLMAIKHGSTMVRIGSSIFGVRSYSLK
ncbi:MAG: YggS family pyridoxal phosphate-dependent enzyme [Bacteroidia bacterium]|nr:YggS family pyridoxal phosphate-dependent enzyme [Bacteroidia bacterium]